ncbi:hypothetical protein KJ781_01380 [Patescibacteria group bacterium]|nr:hypothetical protein [Patescibacteria group bacterium]MBU1448814.1 hypothetical protein [Patescibacteria group bacterium]MBU2613074.1 hypothetical protein [Patescibacteria group bacterium]
MDAVIGYLTSLNWNNPGWDGFILLFFVVGALLYGLSLGRDRVIVILVGIYMSLAVVTNAPALTNLQFDVNISENAVVRISVFLGVFVVLFFLLSRSALLRTLGRSGAPGSWWQTIVFSILQVGLLISVTLTLLPPEMTQGLTDVTKQIFMSDKGRTAWLILPILIMAIAPKQKEPGAV